MSTFAATSSHLNGNGVVPTEVHREVDFLQHLLQIRDDVFASKHPRIHLPAKVIEQVAPRLPQTTTSSRPTTNGTPNGISSSQLFAARPDSSFQAPSTANEFAPPVVPTQRPYSAISASSGIDPVLLTKSEHLIRAELQLRRQQIERLLKDQFDKKGRGNDTDEREAHLNVEECLIQAQLRVPPVSGIRSTTNNSDGAESFDENSYYSSKADSWSSEELDPKHVTNADLAETLTSQGKHISNASAQAQLVPVQPAVIDLDEEAYEPADDIEIYEPEPAHLLDDAEEEDYSPPPADIVANEPSRGRARARGHQNLNGTNGYDMITFFLSVPPYSCWQFESSLVSRVLESLPSKHAVPRWAQACGAFIVVHVWIVSNRVAGKLVDDQDELSVCAYSSANLVAGHLVVTVQPGLLLHCKTRGNVEEKRRSGSNNNNNSSSSNKRSVLPALLSLTSKKSHNPHRLSPPTPTPSLASDVLCSQYPMKPISYLCNRLAEDSLHTIGNQNHQQEHIASMKSLPRPP
jgi:hypothetical protein